MEAKFPRFVFHKKMFKLFSMIGFVSAILLLFMNLVYFNSCKALRSAASFSVIIVQPIMLCSFQPAAFAGVVKLFKYN